MAACTAVSSPSASRTAPQHRLAQRVENGVAQARRAQDELGLELAGDAVEARVQGSELVPLAGSPGSGSASRSATEAPRRASARATAQPTTPAPITATSTSMPVPESRN
jgi:hypothetical protein